MARLTWFDLAIVEGSTSQELEDRLDWLRETDRDGKNAAVIEAIDTELFYRESDPYQGKLWEV